MRIRFMQSFLISVWLVGLSLVPVRPAAAQTLTTLISFDCSTTGCGPLAGPILVGDTLYGCTTSTIFSVKTNGANFTVLNPLLDDPVPTTRLTLVGDTLYGTSGISGIGGLGLGVLCSINTAGGFPNAIYPFGSFTGDGGNPDGQLAASVDPLSGAAILYGTAQTHGGFGHGTVWVYEDIAWVYDVIVHDFSGDDGINPSGVILSSNTLYGTALFGGSFGSGTIFSVNTNGNGFTVLHHFGSVTNDGVRPQAGLTMSGNTLYGTTRFGGSMSNGIVFRINVDGTGFGILHTFTGIRDGLSSEGANPNGPLTLADNTLYGTTYYGGSLGVGTIFAVNTDGTGFTTLYNFPQVGLPGGLAIAGNVLYGMTGNTLFSLSVQPRLTISRSDTNVLLSWPASMDGFSYGGFSLQSTTNIAAPGAWTNLSVTPFIINNQSTVKQPISGAPQFFRLSK
jgi:uncharacterized repeat protein (TIGR03803 family)